MRWRNRWVYLTAIALTIMLGLGSRHFAPYLPHWVNLYLGDILWGLMVFLGFGLVFPKPSSTRVGAAAVIVAVLVEASQLYHTYWIDRIRHTRLGGLILGFGFSWSDIVCYLLGISMGLLMERLFLFKTNDRHADK